MWVYKDHHSSNSNHQIIDISTIAEVTICYRLFACFSLVSTNITPKRLQMHFTLSNTPMSLGTQSLDKQNNNNKTNQVQTLPAGFNSSVESCYQKVVSGHFWGFLQLGDLSFFKVTLIAENHFSLQSITIPESVKFSVSLTFFAMNLRLCLCPFLSFL
jgi:hypothetical protein